MIVRLREPWDADPARAAALLADAEERETDGVRWFALPPTAPPAAGDEAGGASPPALGVVAADRHDAGAAGRRGRSPG